jgi:hypothetical protein
MTQRIVAEPTAIHVRAIGMFSLAEAKKTFMDMLDAVKQNNVHKVLFDGRDLEGDPQVMERFFYGEFAAHSVAAAGLSPVPMFAYVLKPPVADPGRFGEIVARNRGMIVRVFENPDEALTWLDVPPATNPPPSEPK